MEEIDEIFGNYLRFVFSWEEDENGNKWSEKMDDPDFGRYLKTDFRFSAVNNWNNGGFDIAEWYEGTGDYAKDGQYDCFHQGFVADILDFNSTCEAIRFIENCYILMDYKNICPKMVIRNYITAYLYQISAKNLRDLLLQK